MSAINWYLGTMGFSYDDWKGAFYPQELDKRDYLAYYSEFFNAVEMDSTFYGTPREDYVQRWVQTTPDAFIFCPKMPRQITHELRLKETGEDLATFLQTMRIFREKLGPILIQLPPDFTRAEIDGVRTFLDRLPRDLRFAVEFRHRSWHAKETGEMLQARNICWASAEYIHMPQRVYVTTDFIFIRWIGRHDTYETKDHERVDRTTSLRAWLEDIAGRQPEGFHTVYGFFNDEYSGFAPATCQKFKRLAGLPTRPLTPPRQKRLL